MISILIALMSIRHAHAQSSNLPKPEELSGLGKQLVVNILRGAELPYEQRRIQSDCWKESPKALPNVYLEDNGLIGDETPEAATASFDVDAGYTIETLNVATVGKAEWKGKKIDVNYGTEAHFLYRFYLGNGQGSYLRCTEWRKTEGIEGCSKHEWEGDKTKATIWQILGQLMTPMPEDAPRFSGGKTPWIVTFAEKPLLMGVVLKACRAQPKAQ